MPAQKKIVAKRISKSRASDSPSRSPSTSHTPSHKNEVHRLSRIRGQLDGIERMITEGRYCPDIMNQIKSATAALRSVEKQILHRHLHHCVKEAIQSGTEKNREQKIQELMELFHR